MKIGGKEWMDWLHKARREEEGQVRRLTRTDVMTQSLHNGSIRREARTEEEPCAA